MATGRHGVAAIGEHRFFGYGERGCSSLKGLMEAEPKWGPGAKPLVRVQGAKSPEAETFLQLRGKFVNENIPDFKIVPSITPGPKIS